MKVFAKIVVALLMFATAASAATYTNATVKGNYSLLLEGGGSALVGLLKFDGASHVTLTYTQTGPSSGTFSGTYTVDSNGIGTITFSSQDPAITFTFVLCSVVNGNAKILNMVDTDGGVAAGTATHQ